MPVLQLSQSERDELLQHLDERQRTLINEYLKRGRKTVYTNVLPKGREGMFLMKMSNKRPANGIILMRAQAGKKPQPFCECGRPLRYQYVFFE